MSRPREGEDLQKHTLLLYSGDYARLQSIYQEIGAALIIRRLIRAHLEEVDPTPKLEVNI